MAQYQPILFQHTINNQVFNIFQTLEMVDFKNGLSTTNIDTLINESGVFIAHTYFSADAKHYSGKMFQRANVLDPEVVTNFKYLSSKIKENKIWNPTLSQLVNYWALFENTVLDIDFEGKIVFLKTNNLISRTIN